MFLFVKLFYEIRFSEIRNNSWCLKFLLFVRRCTKGFLDFIYIVFILVFLEEVFDRVYFIVGTIEVSKVRDFMATV